MPVGQSVGGFIYILLVEPTGRLRATAEVREIHVQGENPRNPCRAPPYSLNAWAELVTATDFRVFSH